MDDSPRAISSGRSGLLIDNSPRAFISQSSGSLWGVWGDILGDVSGDVSGVVLGVVLGDVLARIPLLIAANCSDKLERFLTLLATWVATWVSFSLLALGATGSTAMVMGISSFLGLLFVELGACPRFATLLGLGELSM